MKKKKRIERKVVVDHDKYGKPIRKSFYGFSNREIDDKIEAYKEKQLDEYNTEKYISLADYTEYYIETYKEGVVSDLTLEISYYSTWKIINKDKIGSIPLVDVKQVDIQTFFNRNSKRNKWQIQRLHNLLKAVYKSAILNGMTDKSPVMNIRLKYAESGEKQAYNAEDYRRVINFAKDDPDGIGVFIILKTGLRRGELCGLKWSDIDFHNKILNVNRSITFSNNHPVINDKCKTANAIRKIPLDDEFCEYMTTINHKKNDYVLPHRNKLVNPKSYTNHVYKRFNKHLHESYPDIPDLTLHELRHTFGTILYQCDTPLDTISDVMGHGDIQLTKSIYVHNTVEDIRHRINFDNLP